VEQNSTVRSIATPFPLTCLGFKQDGVIIAIGTTTGSVLLYDLSSGAKTPLMTFDNFNKNLISRVDFLEFPVGWLNSGSQQTITSGSLTSTAATPQKLPNRGPAFVTTRRVPTIAAAALDPDQTMNYMEMFSPVAGGAVSNSRQVLPLGSGELTAQTSQRSMPLFDALSIGSGKSEQPAKEANAPNSKSEVATPTPAFTRADSLPSLPISTQLPSIAERRPSKSADDLSLPSTRRSPVPSLATDTDDPPDQQQELAPLKIPPVTMSAAVNNAIETMEDSMAKQTTLAQEKFTKQLEVVADVNNGGYSSELLSSTLNDVLMDFRRQVRTDLNNIHVELLRQFETQQNQMQLMIQQSHERMLTAMHQLILGDFPGTTAKDVGK
jgi:hypothetical protein